MTGVTGHPVAGREQRLVLDCVDFVSELCDEHDETVELEDGTRTRGRIPGLVDLLDIETRGAGSKGGGYGGSAESRLPIFTPAFDALLTMSSWAIRESGTLGVPIRGDLRDSLRGLLGGVAGKPVGDIERVRNGLGEHVAHARAVLTIDLPPVSLRGVRCPYCDRASILASRRESKAWCSTADCRDAQDRRYVWAGEVGLRLLGASQPVPVDAP